MKEEKMLRAFSLVDDDLVENAAPKPKKPKIPLWWKRLAYIAVAASLMLVILLPLLFGGGHESVPVSTTMDDEPVDSVPVETPSAPAVTVPAVTASCTTSAHSNSPGPLDAYKDSEYFPLIEKLDKYLQDVNDIHQVVPNQPSSPTIPGDDSNDGLPDDIPADQLQRMIGADRIKQTDTHIFFLKNKKLEAYTAMGSDSKCVGSYDAEGATAFYLLDEGNKILLLRSTTLRTTLVLLDVSNPADMKEIRRVRITGKISSSYMTDDGFLLGTNYTVWEKPSYDNPASFVPYMEYDGGAANHLPMEDILMTTEDLLGLDYAVLYSLDPETLELQSRKAFLDTASTIYVSNEHVFVAKAYRDRRPSKNKKVSDIRCLSYQDGALAYKGMVTIDGHLTGPYSIDEKDGILRVVTEMGYYTNRYDENYNRITYVGASLYCVSLDTFEVLASVEEFSPNGESVESVRFDGDRIYVCTSLSSILSSPLFFLDLSDLSNITCQSTGVTGGYSSSLVQFGNGDILGIGYDARDLTKGEPLKLEVYRVEGDNVVSVNRYLVENEENAFQHKPYYLDRSYYIDSERQLVGFVTAVKEEDNSVKTYYLLLHFDGEKFVEVLREECEGALSHFRSVIIDNSLYIFSDKACKVIEVNL